MESFYGSYPRQLDDRGRFVLPSKIREKMSETVHIARSLVDKCLLLYSEEEWDTIKEQIQSLPAMTDANASDLAFVLLGLSSESEVDKQGRVGIPQAMLDAFGIGKDIVLVGVGLKIEIWDAAAYQRKLESLNLTKTLEGIAKFGLNM